MEKLDPSVAQQIAQAASAFEQERTGHLPTSPTVVLSEQTLYGGAPMSAATPTPADRGDSGQCGVKAPRNHAEWDPLRLQLALRESQQRYQRLVEAVTTYPVLRR